MEPLATLTAPPQRQSGSLADRLYQLHAAAKHDGDARARLAWLRRGLTDLHSREVYRALGTEDDALIPAHDYADDTHDASLMTAVLFARLVQGRPTPRDVPRFEGEKQNLGGSARLLRDHPSAGHESLDRRFAGLLEARFDNLLVPLRQLVHLMASNDIPIDIEQLHTDLKAWSDHPSSIRYDKNGRPFHTGPRGVRDRWARTYWRP